MKKISKYNKLWNEDIGKLGGVAIDHSFLNYKKELVDYGYEVGKTSLKEEMVIFSKITN